MAAGDDGVHVERVGEPEVVLADLEPNPVWYHAGRALIVDEGSDAESSDEERSGSAGGRDDKRRKVTRSRSRKPRQGGGDFSYVRLYSALKFETK